MSSRSLTLLDDFERDRRAMKRALGRVFASLYMWNLLLLMLPCILALQLVVGALAFLCSAGDRYVAQRAMRRVYHASPGVFLHPLVNPFWRLQVANCRESPRDPWELEARAPEGRQRKALVMANHVSYADVFVCNPVVAPVDCVYISKASNFRIPFVGWSMRLAGGLPVRFVDKRGGWATEKGSVPQLMRDCAALLERAPATALMVYPEGTCTGQSRELRELKPGFFRFAVENGCDILPFAAAGAERAWPLRARLWSPACVRALRGPRIAFDPARSAEQLRELTHAALQALLYELAASDDKSE